MQELKCCDNQNFREYKDYESNVIGKCCNNCGVEFVKKSFIKSAVDTPHSSADDNTFEEKKPIEHSIKTQYQVAFNKTRIRNANQLQPGDHVAWQRAASYWHEAIVTDPVDKDGKLITISWTTKDNDLGIFENPEPDVSHVSNSCFNQMYRINYPPEIVLENSTELVLARAKSRISRPGDNDAPFYDLLNDNCESFATYCKTGLAESHQVRWFEKKIRNIACGVCTKSCAKGLFVGAVMFSEVVEESVEREVGYKWSQAIAAMILIFLELCFVFFDIRYMYYHPNTTENFREECTRRLWEAMFAVAISLLFSATLDFFSGCLHNIFKSIFCSHETVVIGIAVIAVICGLVIGGLGGIIGGYLLSKLQAAKYSRRNTCMYLLAGLLVGILAGCTIGCVGGGIGGVIGVALSEWGVNGTIFAAVTGGVIGLVGGFSTGLMGVFFGPRCRRITGCFILILTCIFSSGVAVLVGLFFNRWANNEGRSQILVATFDVVLGLIGGITGGIVGRMMGTSVGSAIGRRCCHPDSVDTEPLITSDSNRSQNRPV